MTRGWVANWATKNGYLNAEGEGDYTLATHDHMYLTAIYWAVTTITTVGYGDVIAETNLEKVRDEF